MSRYRSSMSTRSEDGQPLSRWRVHDPFFIAAGAEAFRRDNPGHRTLRLGDALRKDRRRNQSTHGTEQVSTLKQCTMMRRQPIGPSRGISVFSLSANVQFCLVVS